MLYLSVSHQTDCIYCRISPGENFAMSTNILLSLRAQSEFRYRSGKSSAMELVNISNLHWSNNTGGENIEKTWDGISICKILVCFILILTSFILNLRVVCVVLTMPTKKRNANILIAHLSVVNIFLNYFVIILLLSKSNTWSVDDDYGLCVGHAYFRNALVSLIPVNVTAIVYDKMKVLQPNYIGEKLLVKRTVAFMWIVVLVGSLPNLLTTRYLSPVFPNTTGECKLEPILGSIRLTFGFELARLIVYHITPTIYIFYALMQIKAKVSKYLFTTANKATSKRLKLKVRKVRYIVLNGVAFIFIWLPTVVLLFIYKIQARSGEPGESSTSESTAGFHFFLIVFLGYIYIMLNPLIQLHLSEHLGDLKWYSIRFPQSSPPRAAELANIAGENATVQEAGAADLSNEIGSGCTSRESTFQRSCEVTPECNQLAENTEGFHYNESGMYSDEMV